jgi:hypothetical protein
VILGLLAIVRESNVNLMLRVEENGGDGSEGDPLVGWPEKNVEFWELPGPRA